MLIAGFRDFRQLERIILKVVNIRAQIVFLTGCLSSGLIPRRFIIRSGFRDRTVKNWMQNLSFRTMKRERNFLYSKLNDQLALSKDIQNSLGAKFTEESFNFHLGRIKRLSDNTLKKLTSNLNIKKEKILNSDMFKPLITFKPRKPCYLVLGENCVISDDSKSFLNYHPNFAVGFQPNLKENLVTDIYGTGAFGSDNKTTLINRVLNMNKNDLNKAFNLNTSMMNKCKIVEAELMSKDLRLVPTDKSGQLYIINQNEYNTKLMSAISGFCDEDKHDRSMKINNKLRGLLNDCGLEKDVCRRLINSDASTPQLFGFVKSHKLNLPIRPIITTKGGPLEYLGVWLKRTLISLLDTREFTLKDSFELARCLNDLDIKGEFLVSTADIRSMFPSVSRPKMLLELNSFLINKQDEGLDLKLQIGMDREAFIGLLSFYLDSIQVQFQGKFFSQKDGLSIGSAISPILADFYVDRIEKRIVNETIGIIFYRRFVDDMLVVYKPELGTLEENFLGKFTHYDNNLKFDVENEVNGEIQFLDIKISKRGDGRSIDWVYCNNPKKEGTILNFNSNHGESLKSNIVINQIKRGILLSSSNNVLKGAFYAGEKLLNNGYPKSKVLGTLRRELSRSDRGVFKRNEQRSKRKFAAVPFIKGLSDVLKYSNDRVGLIQKPGLKLKGIGKAKCNNPKEVSNVIYRIPCSCGRSYIGQTGRKLGTRIKEHLANLRKSNKTSNLVRHVLEFGCLPRFEEVSILEVEPVWRKRVFKESLHMVKEGNTISQPSFNLNEDISSFYLYLVNG